MTEIYTTIRPLLIPALIYGQLLLSQYIGTKLESEKNMKTLLRDNPMIVVALVCAIFIGFFWIQSINERKIETENQTLIDKINNTTFVNTDIANELYQIKIVDGLADVRRNTKHYTTPYQTINADTISFKSPQDEPVIAKFIDTNTDITMQLSVGDNDPLTLKMQ